MEVAQKFDAIMIGVGEVLTDIAVGLARVGHGTSMTSGLQNLR
jgi:hypothetical protein